MINSAREVTVSKFIMNKEIESEAVREELSSLIEMTLRLEEELNLVVGAHKSL